MSNEYENTDGSRSGEQPVLLPCGHCGEQCADLMIDQGDKWAHYSASCLEVRTGYNLSDDAPWRAEAIAAYNKRQTTQIDALKVARKALEGMVKYSGMRESWQDDNPQYVEAADEAIDVIDAVLKEQANG